MAQKKFQPKSKNWIVTLAFACSALAYVFFVFLPRQQLIAKSRLQIREMQQYIVDAARLTSTIVNTEQDLTETRGYVREWREKTPRPARVGSVFGTITERAKEAQTTIVRFAPKPADELDLLHTVPVALTVEGTFQQLFEFVRGLEDLPSTVWISDLNIEPGREAGGKLMGDVTLVVFADNSEFAN